MASMGARVAVALTLAGASAGVPAAQAQTVATTQEIADKTLAEPLKTTLWRWQRGRPPVKMHPAATHVCLVTKVTGHFAGYGERVGLSIDTGATGGPHWMLNGTSGQDQLAIEATCAPKRQFVTRAPFTMSAAVLASRTQRFCPPSSTPIKAGPSHAPFLSGMAGKFAGGGEAVIVEQDTMVLHGCSGSVEGPPLAIAASPLRVYRTQRTRTAIARDATFTIGISQPKDHWLWGEPHYKEGVRSIFMVPVDEALCGLTRVQGNFKGYGEAAHVNIATGPTGRKWWTLEAATLASASTTTAAARCLARDQR